MEPEKAHPTGEFVIVAKFSDHVLRRLASSLSNVGRQTKIPAFFTIQYLAFGYYFVVLNAIFGYVSAKIPTKQYYCTV